MPEGAVYVGRGSRWGNPFIVGTHGTTAECVELFRKLCYGLLCISVDLECVKAQHKFWKATSKREIVDKLGGKDLACWCSLSKPCHADVLIEVANN